MAATHLDLVSALVGRGRAVEVVVGDVREVLDGEGELLLGLEEEPAVEVGQLPRSTEISTYFRAYSGLEFRMSTPACRRWRPNPFGKCSQERLTRSAVRTGALTTRPESGLICAKFTGQPHAVLTAVGHMAPNPSGKISQERLTRSTVISTYA